jgi:hypothetical protein
MAFDPYDYEYTHFSRNYPGAYITGLAFRAYSEGE